MSEQDKGTSPANGGIDIPSIVKSVTEQVTASFKSQLDELAKNQKVFADTFDAEIKKLTATPASTKDEKKAEPITAESVSKIVADALAARDQEVAGKAKKAEAVKSAREKVGKDKLFGNADLIALLPETDDESALAASADQVLAAARKLKPDFGNAGAKDGGTSVGGDAPTKAVSPGNLTPGAAKFAATIKLPK